MSVEGHDYEANLLRRYEHWAVYLHENQAYLGRTYIALGRDGEIDPFLDTNEGENSELPLVVSGIQRCLAKLYKPDRLNYANLRNTWDHCHWHVIPRYETPREVEGHIFVDHNWGKNYAPYDLNFQLSVGVFDTIKDSMAAELAAMS